jgi:hypothetical protein
MLGAIKIKGEAGASLFRTLSRRWAPVVPIKDGLPASSHALGLEQGNGASPKRAWIGVKRQSVPAKPAVSAKRPRTAWNPWLWTK